MANRRRFDVAEYAENQGAIVLETSATNTSILPSLGESVEDPYLEAKKQALDYMSTTYQSIMTDPFKHPKQIEEAIYDAVSQTSMSGAQAKRLREEIHSDVLGAGTIQKYLDDDTITEIMVNGRNVYIERSGVLSRADSLASDEEAAHLAQDLAQKVGERFQVANPILDFAWLDGSRVHMTHEELSSIGATITIRKRDKSRPLELGNLVEKSMLSPEAADFLVTAIRGRLNIIVSGSTGSGKTTLMRALITEALKVSPNERLIVIEDTAELQLKHPHTLPMQARHKTEGDKSSRGVDVQELTVSSKRMRPDRVILGEVRAKEAIDLLDIAQSETGGVVASIHLKKPEDLINKMFFIAQRSGIQLSKSEMKEWVYEAIDLIVHVHRDVRGNRRILRIAELVEGKMVDVFRYDLRTDSHVQVGQLTPEREQQMEIDLDKRALRPDRRSGVKDRRRPEVPGEVNEWSGERDRRKGVKDRRSGQDRRGTAPQSARRFRVVRGLNKLGGGGQ